MSFNRKDFDRLIAAQRLKLAFELTNSDKDLITILEILKNQVETNTKLFSMVTDELQNLDQKIRLLEDSQNMTKIGDRTKLGY